MAKKDDTVLSDLSLDELIGRVEEESDKYAQLKFNHAVTPLESPAVIRSARRDVARLKTELRKREISDQNNKTENNKAE